MIFDLRKVNKIYCVMAIQIDDCIIRLKCFYVGKVPSCQAVNQDPPIGKGKL